MQQIYPDIKRLFDSVKAGRKPKYSPADLVNEFTAYVEDLAASPVEVKTEYRRNLEWGEQRQTKRECFCRPPKVYDFVVRWLGMSESWWRELGRGKRAEAFLTVKEKIERYCYDCKFDGAAIGFYNANIIARDLGLKDRVEYEKPGEEKEMTLEGINAEIARLEKLEAASK